MTDTRKTITTMVAAAALAGCSVSSPPVTVATPSGMATASASGTLDLPGFTEQNLMHHMIVGDSVEVAMSQRAAARTTNAAVRDLATMLASDHIEHMQKLIALSARDHIERSPYAGDTSGMHMMHAVMMEMPDSAWAATSDQAFVRHQIMHHAHELAMLRAERPAAHDDEFEKVIDATVPVLQQHLARAQQVGLQIGVDTASAMSGMMHHPPAR
jgi:uncharacterized protein (DUF305 family)